MTSKKRYRCGSRTHNGGTCRNRRGADHHGGRGRAGRDKHEFHNYEPLGKHGLKRPGVLQDNAAEVRVQKLDEDAALLAADGVAEKGGDAYVVGARDVAKDGWETDVVKILGGGQVRNELHIVANAFAADAVELIGEVDGDAELSKRAEEAAEAGESADANEDDKE